VQFLLEHGAGSAIRSPEGRTLHEIALEKGHQSVADVLRAIESETRPTFQWRSYLRFTVHNQYSAGDAYRNAANDTYGKCRDHGFDRMPLRRLMVSSISSSAASPPSLQRAGRSSSPQAHPQQQMPPGKPGALFGNLIAVHSHDGPFCLTPLISENHLLPELTALSLDCSLPGSSATGSSGAHCPARQLWGCSL